MDIPLIIHEIKRSPQFAFNWKMQSMSNLLLQRIEFVIERLNVSNVKIKRGPKK